MSTFQTSPIDIPIDSFYPVIVVGGGTCGLAVTARLCEPFPGSLYTEDEHQRFHWLNQRGHKVSLIGRSLYKRENYFKPEDILVLDAHGDKFVSAWDLQFAACQIPFLRSPMFFHVDPVDVDALVCFSHDKQDQLMEVKNVVGKEFLKHQAKRMQKKKMGAKKGAGSHHDRQGIVDINMRDWKDYYRPSTKLFREHCSDVISRYNLQDCVQHDEVALIEYKYIQAGSETGQGFVITTRSGRIFGCKACIVASGHRGEINYPIAPFKDPQFPLGSCHTTHLFYRQVQFLGKELMEKPRESKQRSIVIVGGGLTSAQLAHVAVTKGVSKVYLLFRGAIKIKHFDFHLDWVTKYKNVKKSAFYIKDTDEERFDMIQEAREGGSVNPEYYKIITKHARDHRLNLCTHTQISEQEWDDETRTWRLVLKNSETMESTTLENVDYIYFATGITANIHSLDFLQPVMEAAPIKTVRGFPCLTDNLQWNEEVPLFMVGKNALLKMGPSLANLDGARLGADRVGWYLQDLLSRRGLDWTTCECCNSDSSSLLDLTESESEVEDSGVWRYKMAMNEMNPFTLIENEE